MICSCLCLIGMLFAVEIILGLQIAGLSLLSVLAVFNTVLTRILPFTKGSIFWEYWFYFPSIFVCFFYFCCKEFLCRSLFDMTVSHPLSFLFEFKIVTLLFLSACLFTKVLKVFDFDIVSFNTSYLLLIEIQGIAYFPFSLSSECVICCRVEVVPLLGQLIFATICCLLWRF